MALTSLVQVLIRAHFAAHETPLDLAIDATCGNGHDTLFLAELGFNRVIGFDIQKRAIELTGQRLAAAGFENVLLLQQGHEHLTEHLGKPVNCIMFNFGYLPNADKCITTTAETSLIALNAALQLLSPTGVISLMCYPGHSAGAEETGAIKNWLAALDSCWTVEQHNSNSPKPTAPVLFLMCRNPRLNLTTWGPCLNISPTVF